MNKIKTKLSFVLLVVAAFVCSFLLKDAYSVGKAVAVILPTSVGVATAVAMSTEVAASTEVATSTAVPSTSTPTATPSATPTPQPTLPATLTPLPASQPALAAPTALYTPQKLSADDQAAYEQALKDIPVYRQGDLRLTLQDENGEPLSGYAVHYRQVSHDFMFGGIADPFDSGSMKQIGINTITANMDWRWIEPNFGKFTPDDANSLQGIDELKSGGMAVRTYNLFNTSEDMAPYFRGIPYDEFLARLYNHAAATVQRFAPSVDVWEAVLEPNFVNHDPLGLLKYPYYQAIAASIRAIRDNDPDARVEINLGHPCGGIDWLDNFQTVQEMLDLEIDFDVIGLQFFYNAVAAPDGSQMPRASFSEMNACYDRYAEMLAAYDKRIVVSAISVPSEAAADENGYWDVPWSEDTQAQYLDTAYTIFFSKPSNLGLVWWNTVEPSPFIYQGGLIREDGVPKKSGAALQRLIETWSTTGEGITDADGTLTLRGFGGDYELAIMDPSTGAWMAAQAHVTEQQSSDAQVQFNPNNRLMEKKINLEDLVSYWEFNADPHRGQKGKDFLALVDHHLKNSEWALAEQTLDAGIDELANQTQTIILVNDWLASGYDNWLFEENGSAVMWGSTTLRIPQPFPPGTASVEIKIHANHVIGEVPRMVVGVGANYSPVWKIENEEPQVYVFTTPTTGSEQVLTIRFPYDDRIYDRIIAQGGDAEALKLYIDEVKLTITSPKIPQ